MTEPNRATGASSLLRSVADGLLSLVLAPACARCRRPLDHPTRAAVCDGCWASIKWLAPPFCAVCAEPLRQWREPEGVNQRCPRCRSQRGAISYGRAVGEYDGALREILHAFKYERRRTMAPALAKLMRARGRAVLTGADVVVPVPLHWRRQWRRGFNQSAELAAGLGLPVLHALRRLRHTPSQTDLPAHERHANVRSAFRLKPHAVVLHLTVVLVDDVSTTGATLEACAGVLREGGAKEVRTLTAARVLSRRSD